MSILIFNAHVPLVETPEQFGAFIHAEIEKNAKLIKLIRAKTE